jgi:hypothetical protein
MTATEVGEALGTDFNIVKQRLWHMSREGQALASGGRYSLPKDRNLRKPRNRDPEESATTVTQVTHNFGEPKEVARRDAVLGGGEGTM